MTENDIIEKSLKPQAFLEDLMNVNENNELELKSSKGCFLELVQSATAPIAHSGI